MSAIVHEADTATADGGATATAPATPPRRGFRFWVVRYLPAEVAGTASMLLAGLAVTGWSDSPAVIAVAALLGETLGFYLVLGVTVFVEVRPRSRTRRGAAIRTVLLLFAEFGAAELVDTLLIRPAALVLGVWLVGEPAWGLLAGKVVADAVFYAIAAGAFVLTARWGMRGESRERAS